MAAVWRWREGRRGVGKESKVSVSRRFLEAEVMNTTESNQRTQIGKRCHPIHSCIKKRLIFLQERKLRAAGRLLQRYRGEMQVVCTGGTTHIGIGGQI